VRRVRRPHWPKAPSVRGRALLALLALSAATACSSPAAGVPDSELRLVVADSCAALAGRLAQAYEQERPGVDVEIDVFNSGVAAQRLRDGNADLALISWLDRGRDADGIWTHDFAPQAVAVIVHPSLPLEETELDQLRAVFQAQLQELDGQQLQPVSREEGAGIRAFFEWIVLGSDSVAQTAIVMPSSQSVVEYVGRSPGAVGYVSTTELGEPANANVRVLRMRDVLPSAAAASDGSYPLANRLWMATVGEPRGEAREFAQWLLGPGGQGVIWDE
jgi:phosphate transport system substrate-binding protein